MKRRRVQIRVTDHAVIRYLERGLDIDVDALRSHIASLAQDAAEMGAIGLKVDQVKLVIMPDHTDVAGTKHVRIPTVLERNMQGAVAKAHARGSRKDREADRGP